MNTLIILKKYKNQFGSIAENVKTKHGKKILVLMALSLVASIPELAIAQTTGGNPWDSTARNVLGMFTGGMSRTIAILAVTACGIAAVVGKLSWDWAIKIIIGIVLIFGAAKFVDYIVSSSQ